jgi:excisionase family DNA binding protein
MNGSKASSTSVNGRAVLTVAETAERLGISPRLAYELVRTGEIPARRLGRKRWVVGIATFEQWLLERETD